MADGFPRRRGPARPPGEGTRDVEAPRRDRHLARSPDSVRRSDAKLALAIKVVTSLIDQGLLPVTIAVNPVKRCLQRVVLEIDLTAFDASFVSLHSLAKERGVYFQKLKAELVARGVAPDPAFADVPASFYRRADIGDPPT